jgi:hypothetical protein
MTGTLRSFSRVSSGGVSTAVSSRKFFSTAVEAEEGRTIATVSFGSSSSLREDIWDQNKVIKASNDYWLEKENLRVSFKEVE